MHIADNILYLRLNSFKAKRISSSLKRLDGLWDPLSLVINMHRGIKRPGPETDHSPPSNAEAKNARNYISASHDVPKACCLICHRGNSAYYLFTHLFTIYLTTCIQRQTVNDQRIMKRRNIRKETVAA